MKIITKILLSLCFASLALSLTLDTFLDKNGNTEYYSGLLTGFSIVILVAYIVKKIFDKLKIQNLKNKP
jgi:hypothetical protein